MVMSPAVVGNEGEPNVISGLGAKIQARLTDGCLTPEVLASGWGAESCPELR
jgi:hypothetical protein